MPKKEKYWNPVVIAAVIGIIAFAVIGGRLTGHSVREDANEEVVIYFPTSVDFPSSERGTVVFEFSFPDASFRVGNRTADFLMFLDSVTIPGLKVGYNTKERKIHAGMPVIVSEEVTILDGHSHKMSYSFSRELKKQAIFLDDRLLVEGEFNDKANAITGFAVYPNIRMVESTVPIDIRFE